MNLVQNPAPAIAAPLAWSFAAPRAALEARDGASLLRRLRAASGPHAAGSFDHWLTRLQAAWHAGDQALALAAADAAGALAGPSRPAADLQRYHLFAALALARSDDPATLPALRRHCAALRGLDRGCGAGGGALPALAQAALERRRGEALKALRGFEQAAEAAARCGLHWAATVACEQAAQQAHDCGLASAARHYRRQALDACRRRGAPGRLEALRAAGGEDAARPDADGCADGRADHCTDDYVDDWAGDGVRSGLAVAHELNQPLAAVTLHAAAAGKWLRRPQPDIERALDSLALIGAAGRQAGDIVRGMRRLAAGHDHETAGIDLDTTVRDTLRLLHAPLRKHGIEVELALGLDGCGIRANRAQLQQVVTNLVMNAIEAHGSAGAAGVRRLRIASRRHGREVELEVGDNGPGVAPHDRERIFASRFSTKRRVTDMAGAAAHAGLGLSISLSIARAHGGRLWFEPRLPQGATFRLRLPLQAGQEPA